MSLMVIFVILGVWQLYVRHTGWGVFWLIMAALCLPG
jgi:hypothetical protein